MDKEFENNYRRATNKGLSSNVCSEHQDAQKSTTYELSSTFDAENTNKNALSIQRNDKNSTEVRNDENEASVLFTSEEAAYLRLKGKKRSNSEDEALKNYLIYQYEKGYAVISGDTVNQNYGGIHAGENAETKDEICKVRSNSDVSAASDEISNSNYALNTDYDDIISKFSTGEVKIRKVRSKAEQEALRKYGIHTSYTKNNTELPTNRANSVTGENRDVVKNESAAGDGPTKSTEPNDNFDTTQECVANEIAVKKAPAAGDGPMNTTSVPTNVFGALITPEEAEYLRLKGNNRSKSEQEALRQYNFHTFFRKNREPPTSRADNASENIITVTLPPPAGDGPINTSPVSTNTNKTLLSPEQETYLHIKGVKRSHSEEEILHMHLNYQYNNTAQRLMERNNANRPGNLGIRNSGERPDDKAIFCYWINVILILLGIPACIYWLMYIILTN